MYARSAHLYDAISSWKDYAREAERIRAIIATHKRSTGNSLLDVACGTGKHLERLREYFEVEGLDIEPNLLAVAHERLPGVRLHQADMCSFNLGRRFDVVTCLFSAIGYAGRTPKLQQALQAFSRHVVPGGVVIVEPWIRPDQFRPNDVSARFVDEPGLKIARIHTSEIHDGLWVMDFNYLVGTSAGVEYFSERHEMGLFTHDDYEDAFRQADLEVTHDPEGLMGRGLYIGTKTTEEKTDQDPILRLRGMGAGIATGEHPDDYVPPTT
jgi:SAM-dependent methyltransferase